MHSFQIIRVRNVRQLYRVTDDATYPLCVKESREKYCSHCVLWSCRYEARGVIAQHNEGAGDGVVVLCV